MDDSIRFTASSSVVGARERKDICVPCGRRKKTESPKAPGLRRWKIRT
jgi:hypothetical protein